MVARCPTAFLAIAFLAIAVSAAPLEWRVTGNRVNLRARPIANAEVVGQVSVGAKLVSAGSLTEGSEWIGVRPPREVDLWVYSQLLTANTVNADNTLVRGGPGLQFKSVGKLAKGTVVELRGEKGDWTRIAPVEGRCEVWIHSDFVEKIVPPPPPVRKTVPVAVRPASPDVPGTVPPKTVPRSAVAVVTNPPPARIVATSRPVVVPVARPKPPVATPPSSPSPAVPGATPPSPVKPAGRPAEAAVPSPSPAAVAPKVAPIVDAPASGLPVVLDKDKVPAVPAALAGIALDDHYRQGDASVLKGRLRKVSSFSGPSPARFQLVENATIVCRLTGCVGQWAELVDSDVQVRGTLWMLSGDPVPVLHAVRADRLASWDK